MLRKWILKILKVEEYPTFHSILSKEHPNVFHIDVGNMSPAKARIEMRKLAEDMKESYPEYRFIFIPRNS